MNRDEMIQDLEFVFNNTDAQGRQKLFREALYRIPSNLTLGHFAANVHEMVPADEEVRS